MRKSPLLTAICLAACSGGDRNGNAVDVEGAATRAQRDIANYAAGTSSPPPAMRPPVPSPTPDPQTAPAAVSSVAPPVSTATTAPASAPVRMPAAISTPAPGPAASDGRLSAPPAARTAGAAAGVVRDYVAALSTGRFKDAWLLWRDRGRASGMTAGAFARSFAKYASITGTVGTPYDQDAGAGQVYITVPVTLRGTLKQGGSFRLQGPVVLHRANDMIETTDAADHLWRIERSDLKPRPLEHGGGNIR